jgi:hypothetical protein
MKIALKLVVMPEPTKKKPGTCLLSKAKQWVEDCMEGADDSSSWNKIRMLFNKLAGMKKLSPAQQELMDLIVPVVEKYGMHDARGVDLRAEHLSVVRGTEPIEDANE